MTHKTITITNKVGLHARPARQFAKTAQTFASDITIKTGDKVANGKSILKILTLGADYGSQLELIINGPDEVDALESLCSLLESMDN